MHSVAHFSLPLLAAALSYCVLRLLLSSRSPIHVVDYPNERSLHKNPVPRTGGIAILSGIALSNAWLHGTAWILAGAGILAAISVLDDWKTLPQLMRLLSHFGVAALFVATSLTDTNPVLAFALVLAVAWMTNLYNFMDGSDGLAAGMAFIGFGFYAVAACLAGSTDLALVCWCVMGAIVPFWVANFAPSRIFMGDVGSIPLGFLAAAVGLLGWNDGVWPLWCPLLVFSPFIVDASVTLSRRIRRGDRFWNPHREHYYQRLVRMGWSHKRTALFEYGLMLMMGGFALITQRMHTVGIALIVGIASIIYVCLMNLVDRAWARHLEQTR